MNKKNAILSLLAFFIANCTSLAQRYLEPIFESVEVTTDITYGNAENYLGESEDLLLDFYQPVDDPLTRRPLIIYIHGGGFTDEAQTKSLVHIGAYCDSMSRRGYATASINYRLDSTISNRAIMNAMYDAKAAVRFFKANFEVYGIDTSLMFIGGESAGAITAMSTNYIRSVGETAFPSTPPMADDLGLEGDSGNPGFSSSTKATLCFCGGTETVFDEPLFDTLAIDLNSDPPVLIVHGSGDPIIPIASTLEIAIRAENIGLPYLFYNMPGATHCPWFFPLENSWEYLDTLIDYTVPFLYACVNAAADISENERPEFIVYPNPVDDLLTINYSNNVTLLIEITDAEGQLVFSKRIYSDTEINTDHWEKGIYFIRSPELGWVQKIVKQ